MVSTKKIDFIGILLCISFVCLLFYSFGASSSFAVIGSNDFDKTEYTLHLEGLNTETTSKETLSLYTENNNRIRFTVKKFANKTFGKSGQIENKDVINGLKSISVSFNDPTSRIVVYYRFFEDGSPFTSEITPANNVLDFGSYSPSYFCLLNPGGSFTVNSIIVNYSCTPGELPPEYSMIQYTREEDTYFVSGYDEGITDGIITRYHDGLPVTRIAADAFSACDTLKTLAINYGLTSIGEAAFYYCTSLETVSLPNSVNNIGDSAFAGCAALSSITLPNSIVTIGNYLFSGCTSLPSINIPNNVTSIGMSAFSECTSLSSVALPTSCVSLGEEAFRYCSNLASINLSNVRSIGKYAFYEDRSLEQVVIGDSLSTIKSHCFFNCTSLNSVTIGASVTSIENNAFYLCSNLKTVINRSSLNIQAGSTSNGYVGYYASIIS